MQKSKLYSYSLLLLISLYNLLFVIASNGNGESRFDQLVLVILVFFFILNSVYLLIKGGSSIIYHILFAVFIFLFTYGISAYRYLVFHNTSELVLSNYSTMLFVLLSLPTGYLLGSRKFVSKLSFDLFVFSLICIAIYSFYLIFSVKYDGLGDSFYKQGNNGGYYFVLLAPICFYKLKNHRLKSLLVAFILFVFVLFAVKRGAILIYSFVFFLFLHLLFTSSSKHEKLKLFILLSLISTPFIIYLLSMSEVFFSRFGVEGGSGRDFIYSTIYDSLLESTFSELFFGHGFFSVTELMFSNTIGESRSMAHSDYLEVIYDIGIIGMCFYLYILYVLIKYIKSIPSIYRYEKQILVICLVIWLLKAVFSGVVIVRNASLLTLTIGFIIGNIEKCKYMKHS